MIVADGRKECDLGICVPDAGAFSCRTRLPCKRLYGTDFKFIIKEDSDLKSVAVESGRVFAYLDKLSAARLRYANGQPEIIIDPIQDPQGNDRSREYQNK